MPKEAITKPYADFKFYQSEYKGIRITSEEMFVECEREAEAYLDLLTFRRIPKLEDADGSLLRDIKYAVCSMAETHQSRKDSLRIAATGVQSESSDGYSVSYAQIKDTDYQYKAAMKNEAQKYLSYTGLFYCGGGSYDLQRKHNDSQPKEG